jgi:hypothetical protein
MTILILAGTGEMLGPGNDGPVAEHLLDLLFPLPLHHSVGRATVLPVRRIHVQGFYRFVDVGGEIGVVDPGGRDEEIVINGALQELGRVPCPFPSPGGVIQDRIPPSARQGRQVILPVAYQVFHVSEILDVDGGLGSAPGENGDLMSMLEGGMNLVRPQKAGATEYEDS